MSLMFDNFEIEKHVVCHVYLIMTAVLEHIGSTAPTTRTISGGAFEQYLPTWPEYQTLRVRFSESANAPSPPYPLSGDAGLAPQARHRLAAAARRATSASPYTASGGEG